MTQYRALISVSDRRGITELAQALTDFGFEIVATGGTARHLAERGIAVRTVESLTGFPEILEGRVKTLHPAVFAGILARSDHPQDLEDLQAHALPVFDLVVVNLYPFEERMRMGLHLEALMDWVDIGGVALVRAAAKNWRRVTVLVDPADYSEILTLLGQDKWPPSEALRRRLAAKAFAYTAVYDAIIAQRFYREPVEEEAFHWYPLALSLRQTLRYGENPHQSGFWYVFHPEPDVALHRAHQLQGKALSYNNILDIDAAVRVVADFEEEGEGVAAVVIKHATPSGVALGETAREAYVRARNADAMAAFGGIAAIGAIIDRGAAEAIIETFMECIVAPGYTEDALAVLAQKKNLRVLELAGPWRPERTVELRSVLGGVLIQGGDWSIDDPTAWQVVTRRTPTEDEWQALRFAWRVVKHVRSNAVVLTTARETLGIGGGQVSRIDAVRIAIQKAPSPLQGAVAASDAFFPFRDSIDELARAGVTAIVQPGGSVRDSEVIAAADEHDMAMVLTGVRHFRH